jgi:hypothetical protein
MTKPKIAPLEMIAAFDPAPRAVIPTRRDLNELTPDEVASALAQGHPKSVPVKVHKGMEGERTGLPHLTPHSLRYRQAHEKMGTKIEPEQAIT